MDTMQISRSKSNSLHRTPAGFTVVAIDGDGLRECLPARPTIAASYPISVRRVATLLHASFRRFLGVPTLRFTSASPPSGYTGEFHPQAVGHVRHTGWPAATALRRLSALAAAACPAVVCHHRFDGLNRPKDLVGVFVMPAKNADLDRRSHQTARQDSVKAGTNLL
jgi:hypothetical protein